MKYFFVEYQRAYIREMYQLLQGNDYVRGDQTAFREALFMFRHDFQENHIQQGQNYLYCIRPFYYHPACKLYHAYNAMEKCPSTSSS